MVLQRSSVLLSVAAGAAVVALCTGISAVALGDRLPDIVMVYLLGVVIAAMRFGYTASLITAALSVIAFDFFFTEPYFSFGVTDKRYFATFAVMLSVAFVISNLMQRIRRSAAAVREREVRTARLYAMSREVSIARSSDDIVRVACRHLRDVFMTDMSIVFVDEAGTVTTAGRTGEDPRDSRELRPTDPATIEAVRSLIGANVGNEPPRIKSASGDDVVGLRVSRGLLGAIVVRQRKPTPFANPADRELFTAFTTQLALAIERAKLAEDAQRAQIEIQRERLRNALLSSVSHDLRTPLGVVKGAVTALLDPRAQLSASRRQEYLETISDEASRLNRLVSNLLSMTSLEAGALRARKEWQPLEEIVGVALSRLEEQLVGRAVRTTIDPEANLVPFDAPLIEQVLINLVENAVRYTPPSSPIEITAHEVDGGVEVAVSDRGPGIGPGQEEHVFEKFGRAAHRPAGGMGLGLTICRGIVTVHGGKIWCENRPSGGASFRFLLPREGEAPAMGTLPDVMAETP
jgi:two-component system sensor histidine kinase KdpD